MNQSAGQLLAQGLVITVLGMGLVFAGLGLLWALIGVLTRLPGLRARETEVSPANTDAPPTATDAARSLTAERARVAALVAGALMANALPIHFGAPIGPAFEHGRTAPSWVIANRARGLQPWQPGRPPE